MAKTLKELIEEEYWAVNKLDHCGFEVELCASGTYMGTEKDHEEAIKKRDEALVNLNNIRKELKEYLVDIINNY